MACSICDDEERREFINPRLRQKRSFYAIERESRNAGLVVKAQTIKRHSTHNILPEGVSKADFAAAVRDAAANKLAAGELNIKAEHGLSAQALLDRRAEKAADRSLLVEMAKLLSGATMLRAPDHLMLKSEPINVTPSQEASAEDWEPDEEVSQPLPAMRSVFAPRR